MIVLDTNVVSELMRASPSAVVVGWVRRHRPDELATTAITMAELQYGIERLPEGRRKALLLDTLLEVFAGFDDTVLPFDGRAAEEYGDIVARRESTGSPIEGFDAQIAAVCRAGGHTLATRNTKDFRRTGITVVDPWRAPRPQG